MSKRYTAIVKIKNRPDGSAHCVKYRFDNLLNFTKFLDKNWTQWKWFNVYSNKDTDRGKQLANFTKFNKPKAKYVQLFDWDYFSKKKPLNFEGTDIVLSVFWQCKYNKKIITYKQMNTS